MELLSSNLEELKSFFESISEKPFRAKQIFEWIYQKGAQNFDEMTNLSNNFKETLKEKFSIFSLNLLQKIESKDGETIKFLFTLTDGFLIEAVLILAPNRRTVCLSTQVGCPVGCAFCASGKSGFKRNLEISEIVEQLLYIKNFLRKKGERLSHVVFMGMGEPLLNLENVIRAIRIINSDESFGISQRRISVSTVGIIESIERLIHSGLRINLVLSLHAPNDAVRQKIIPYASKYLYEDLLAAMDNYSKITKRDVTYEYTLISEINDSEQDAYELGKVLKKRQCAVNLIPYNPIDKTNFKRPENETIEKFKSILESFGIATTWRYTKGKDINAACGQLVLQQSSK